jgi:hypothetical protein
MRKPLKSIGTAVLALVMLGTSIPAVEAAPLRPNMPAQAESDVTQVRDSRPMRYWRHHNRHREWRGHRHWRSDRHWRGDRHYYRHGYYNGHRGYRHWRHGYRRHDGFWYPAGAFAAGVIIGSALADRPVYASPRRLSRSHVEYCMAKYRSYRISDDTYQPLNGPRRRCR